MCYSVSFEIKTGGAGGFLASVRAAGTQQPPAIQVSAEETLRGGADGSLIWCGGGTNPASSLPSPAANAVPTHRVIAIAGTVYFMLSPLNATDLICIYSIMIMSNFNLLMFDRKKRLQTIFKCLHGNRLYPFNVPDRQKVTGRMKNKQVRCLLVAGQWVTTYIRMFCPSRMASTSL